MYNPEENEETHVSEVVNEPKVSETPSILVAPAENPGELSPNPAGSGFVKQLFVDTLPVTGKAKVLYLLNRKTADGAIVGYHYYKWNPATKQYERVVPNDPSLKLLFGEQDNKTYAEDNTKKAPAKIVDGDLSVFGRIFTNGREVIVVPLPPKTQGSYALECTVDSSGVATLTWANKQ